MATKTQLHADPRPILVTDHAELFRTTAGYLLLTSTGRTTTFMPSEYDHAVKAINQLNPVGLGTDRAYCITYGI